MIDFQRKEKEKVFFFFASGGGKGIQHTEQMLHRHIQNGGAMSLV